MKKFKTGLVHLLSVTLLLITQYSFGQFVGTPYIPLQENIVPFGFLYGGSSYDLPNGMDKTSDGGFIVIGTSNSSATGNVTGTNHGGEDAWVTKYNSLGKIEWQRLYGGNGSEEGKAIKQTSDGGYIFTAQTLSSSNGDVGPNHGQGDFWIVKLTATGSITWQKVYGGSSGETPYTVVEATDGYIVAGVATSTDGNVTGKVGDMWVVKLDVSGNLAWQKTYNNPGPNRSSETAYSIIATSDGSGYIIAGAGGSTYRTTDINNGADVFIMKISTTGTALWKVLYGGDKTDTMNAISQTSDGGFIAVGYSQSSANGDVAGTSNGSSDEWILRLDASGTILWQKLYGGSNLDIAYSVQQTANGGFIVAGYSQAPASGTVTGTNHGGTDAWLLRLDSTGAIQWQRLYGGSGSDAANSLNVPTGQPVKVIETTDGGFLVVTCSTSSATGDVTDTTNGNVDYWLFKTDPNGNIIGVPNIGQ